MRWIWRLGLVCVLLLAACSDSKSSSPPSQSSSGAPALRSPASAQLTLAGDAGLAGPAANASVRCRFPDYDGASIAVLADATNPSMQYRIGVLANKVTVRVSTGSGTDYTERDFSGPGVSSFDPGTGAQLDATLTEIPVTPAVSSGTLGVVTAIKGSIDCAEQQPGTSTITLTGDSLEGRIDSAVLDHAVVECNPGGNEVVVVGILTVGSTKVFVELGLRPDGASVRELLQQGGEHQYLSPGGSATITDKGGHVSGDAIEQGATPPHSLHLEGDAVCSPDAG